MNLRGTRGEYVTMTKQAEHQRPLKMCAGVNHVKSQQQQLAHTSRGETSSIPVRKLTRYSDDLISWGVFLSEHQGKIIEQHKNYKSMHII